MRQRVEEALQVFVQKRVVTNSIVEVGELGRSRQFAVDEQPRRFEVGGVLGDLVDGGSAVPQNALVAVDVSDIRPRRRGIYEPVVECRETGLLRQRRDVDG